MKTIMIFIIMMTGAYSFAGGTVIRCIGHNVNLEVGGKGPQPMDDMIPIKLGVVEVNFLEITQVEGPNSYDNTIVYQSRAPIRGFTAVLKYIDSKLSLSVFMNGSIYEESIKCTPSF